MTTERYFLLTEAAAMIPLVHRVLVDVREARARLAGCEKKIQSHCLDASIRHSILATRDQTQAVVADCLREADDLGVLITPGVRCEALFPFLHKWTGERGDGKVRKAYFVYSDEQETISRWFFAGWPHDRRQIWPHWWSSPCAA